MEKHINLESDAQENFATSTIFTNYTNTSSSTPSSSSTTTTTSTSNSDTCTNQHTKDSPNDSISNTNTSQNMKNGKDSKECKKRQRNCESENINSKHPTYRGVRMRNWGKFVCEIREPKKKSRIWLGTYSTAEMAARAHDVASLAIKGHSAYLNFPQLAKALPRPKSTSPKDIQAAAAKAANTSFDETELPRQEEHDSSSNSPISTNDIDATLFDLPDLFPDGNNGLYFNSSNSSWNLCAVDSGFRVEEQFFWENY